MKVIVAGLSKTGTKSLAQALRILGYRVFDAEQHWNYHMEIWNNYYKDQAITPDYVSMYEGYDAVTGLPACFFFDDIFKAFPDSKVVLSVRDSEAVWRKSMEKSNDVVFSTINQWWLILARHLTPTGRIWYKYNVNSADYLSKVDYLSHNNRARSVIPPNQLLVFNLKDGWKPLCEFLDKEIPKVSFPHRNIACSYVPEMINKSATVSLMYKELIMVFSFVIALAAVSSFLSFAT